MKLHRYSAASVSGQAAAACLRNHDKITRIGTCDRNPGEVQGCSVVVGERHRAASARGTQELGREAQG